MLYNTTLRVLPTTSFLNPLSLGFSWGSNPKRWKSMPFEVQEVKQVRIQDETGTYTTTLNTPVSRQQLLDAAIDIARKAGYAKFILTTNNGATWDDIGDIPETINDEMTITVKPVNKGASPIDITANNNNSNVQLLNFDKKYDRIRRLPIADKIEQWNGKSFLIIGLGGLGFHIAKSIAQTIRDGYLIFVDKENIEDVNLNRFDIDPLYIGLPKVEVVKQIVNSLNPYLRITTYNNDIKEILDDVYHHNFIDVVIDEVDSAEVSRRIYEKTKSIDVPYLSMKYNGFDQATLYVNAIGFDTGSEDPYQIFPSAYFSATIFANLFTYYMFSHTLDELQKVSMVKNISLQKVLE